MPSARRATCGYLILSIRKHISIHALREEGDGDSALYAHLIFISIHALREEGDLCSM